MPVNHLKEFWKYINIEALFSQLYDSLKYKPGTIIEPLTSKTFDLINFFWHYLPKNHWFGWIRHDLQYPDIRLSLRIIPQCRMSSSNIKTFVKHILFLFRNVDCLSLKVWEQFLHLMDDKTTEPPKKWGNDQNVKQ